MNMPSDLDVPQPAHRPGELIRFVTKPSEQRAAARRYLNRALGSLALVALGLVLAFVAPISPTSGWILTAVAAAATLFFAAMWFGAWKAAALTGDDLIDLIVMPDGFITQGGFTISWSEVSQVSAVRVTVAKQRGSGVGGRIGAAVGNAAAAGLMNHGGANIRIDLHLPDCKAAIARTTTKIQKFVLFAEIGRANGHARAMLGLRPMEEIQPLLEILEREARAHGVPFGIVEEEAGS